MRKRAESSRILHDFEIVNSPTKVKVVLKSKTRGVAKRDGVQQPFPDEVMLQLDAFDTTIFFDLTINDLLMHEDIAITV